MRKVLILGKGVQEYALAKYLSSQCEVYVCPGNPAIGEIAQLVDIDNYDSEKIIDFVEKEGISVTIPVDKLSVLKDLAAKFEEKKLPFFAPVFDIPSLFCDKIAVKKLFYKLHFPIPRFASFDKANAAYDYIKNARFPLIIKSSISEYATICVNEKIAKTAIDDLLFRNETILIEEYLYGKTFSVYFISDGYKALPIGTSLNYNFSLDGDGGVLTNGVGACSPFYKLTDAHIDYLTSSIANSIIEYFEQTQKPYVGIFGIECILTDDDIIVVTNLKYFLSDADAPAILELFGTNLLQVIDDCLQGLFADIYEYIPQKEGNAVSLVVSARQDGETIEGLRNLSEDTILTMFPLKKNKYLEYETIKGKNLILTTISGTISRARESLYSEVTEINFKGMTYRKDIGAILSGNRGFV